MQLLQLEGTARLKPCCIVCFLPDVDDKQEAVTRESDKAPVNSDLPSSVGLW